MSDQPRVLSRYKCPHEQDELRRRTLANGSVQYVRQCLGCGKATTNPISRAKISNADTLQPFDEALDKAGYEVGGEDAKAKKDQQREEFFALYDEYLASDDWAERRQLVMERAGGLCEGCRKAPAVRVHHLTYEHVFNELLYELVALCVPCHERAHEKREEKPS